VVLFYYFFRRYIIENKYFILNKISSKETLINKSINENYDYIKNIIKKGNAFKNSKIRAALDDIFNDVILEIYTKYTVDELFDKYLYIPHAHTNTNYLIGLIIYMINLNLYSKSSRHHKKYVSNHLQLFDSMIPEHDKSYMLDKIDFIQDFVKNNNFEYSYKKQIYNDRWGLNDTSIKKVPYRILGNKYSMSINSIMLIVKNIEKEIKKNIEQYDNQQI